MFFVKDRPGLSGIMIEPADLVLLEKVGGEKEGAHGLQWVTAYSSTRFGQHMMEGVGFITIRSVRMVF